MNRIWDVFAGIGKRVTGFIASFEAVAQFWERHSALILAFLASVASLLSFIAGGQDAVNDHLNAMVYQMGHEQTSTIPEVMIIKKDERTSSLLGDNPGRREFASILNLMGKSRRVEDPNATITSINVGEIQFGIFPGGEKPTTVSSIMESDDSVPATFTSFVRFTEKVMRLPEFFVFPSIAFQKESSNASDSPEAFREAQSQAVNDFFPSG